MNEGDHARFRELEPARLGLILNRWKEPHRRWHGLHHLGALLRCIEADPDLSESDREMLGYVALFHDAVYAPLKQDNEEESARLAMDYLPNYSRRDEVVETILATKTHHAENLLAKKFNVWDCARRTGKSCSNTRKASPSNIARSSRRPIAASAAAF